MPDFQTVSAYFNLSGSRDNVVFRGDSEALTYPETLVLAAIHGGQEHVHTVIVQGTVERSMAEEHERLSLLYGDIVGKVFPMIGNMAPLPTGDPSLPTQEEVDASAAAATAAATKIRTKRAAATAAPAQAAPAAVDAPDALPSLDDLPN